MFCTVSRMVKALPPTNSQSQKQQVGATFTYTRYSIAHAQCIRQSLPLRKSLHPALNAFADFRCIFYHNVAKRRWLIHMAYCF